LHGLTIIKTTVTCFVGTGCFLIRCSKGHKINISPIHEVPPLLLKNIIPLIKKISKLQSNNYRNVSTDLTKLLVYPLGSTQHTLGTNVLCHYTSSTRRY